MFLQHVAQTNGAPLMLEISRAEGNYLFDVHGNRYLDLISGISVANWGHGRNEIVEAVQKQAAAHMHTMVYGEMIQQPQVELAYNWAKHMPGDLNCFYFVNSGAEATEGAMKLAKRITGRNSFTALTQAYHGSTQGALSLMSESYFTGAFRPLLPQIRFMDQNDLNAVRSQITSDTAAVVIELIQSEKGAIPCSKEFVAAIRQQCNQTGALLIVDEIQTGCGRTGSVLLSSEYGILPDILLLGKAFGGGMPLAAFVAAREKMALLADQPILGHITTFGGHPVSCAAALASLRILENELDGSDIPGKEQLFRKAFSSRGLPEPVGKGLLMSMDLGSAERCMGIIQLCLKKGLFTDWFLFAPGKLRIAPPLTITSEEIEFVATTIAEAASEFDFGGRNG